MKTGKQVGILLTAVAPNSEVVGSLRAKLWRKMESQVWTQLRDQITGQIWFQIRDKLYENR